MIGRRAFTTFAVIVAAWPALVFAQAGEARPPQTVAEKGPVKLRVGVDKGVAQVAEPIRLVVELEAPRGTRVEVPNLSGQLGDFDVRRSERLKDVPASGAADVRRWTLKATLETIKTGTLTIPPLDVRYATDTKASKFETLRSKPLQIQIASVLEERADLTKFHDIKGAVDVAVPEPPSRAWIAWTAAGAGVLLAGGLLTVAVMTGRQRGPSPAEWALEEIENLQKVPVANAADAEAVFNEVVDVIREFFGVEFAAPTLSQTMREFLAQALQQNGVGDLARKRLAWLARLADEIKFARRGVGEEQVRQALQQARAFIVECQQPSQTVDKEAA